MDLINAADESDESVVGPVLQVSSMVAIGRATEFPDRPYLPQEDMATVSAYNDNVPSVSVLVDNVVQVHEFQVIFPCTIYSMGTSFKLDSDLLKPDILERMAHHLVSRV
jgi:hypothetical protein